MARPVSLIPDITKSVTDNIILGTTNKDAALLSGIGESTFYAWLDRGRRERDRIAVNGRRKVRVSEQVFVEFLDAVEKAEPLRRQALIARVRRSAAGGEEFTETRRTWREVDGQRVLVEEVVTEKKALPQWQAAAWMLERMYPDEFSLRHRLQIDWRVEVRQMLGDGLLTEADVLEVLGDELALEVLDGAGRENGAAAQEGGEEGQPARTQLPAPLPG